MKQYCRTSEEPRIPARDGGNERSSGERPRVVNTSASTQMRGAGLAGTSHTAEDLRVDGAPQLFRLADAEIQYRFSRYPPGVSTHTYCRQERASKGKCPPYLALQVWEQQQPQPCRSGEVVLARLAVMDAQGGSASFPAEGARWRQGFAGGGIGTP